MFAVVYLALHTLLVRNAGTIDVTSIEAGDDSSVASDTIQAGSRAITSLFANSNAVLYSVILFVIMTLSLIWLVRQLEAKKKVTIRQSFYEGMYPLFSVLVSMLRIIVQLIPFALGAYLYSVAKRENVITNNLEEVIFASIWVGSGLLSGYWVSKSILAMYASTLPDVLYVSVARDEVNKQIISVRFEVLRRFLVLPIVIVLGLFAASFLSGRLNSFWEELLLDALLVGSFIFAHIYSYKLYRSVL